MQNCVEKSRVKNRVFRCFSRIALAVSLVFVSGCATLRVSTEDDRYPRALPSDAHIVTGLRTDSSSSIVPLMLESSPALADSSADLTDRIDEVVAAIDLEPSAVTGIASGRFPVGAIRWNLGRDSTWSRVKSIVPYHVHSETGIEVCVVSRDTLIFSTGSMEKSLAQLADGSDVVGAPLPSELFLMLKESEGYLYSRSPDVLLSKLLGTGSEDYPLEEIVILLNTEAAGMGVNGWITLETERQAKTFAVVLRLLLLSEARKAGNEDVSALVKSASIVPSDNRVTFEGVTLQPEQIRKLLSAITAPKEEQ